MAYCKNCGAPLPEGTRLCPECGAAAEDAPARMTPPGKGKKPLYRRWWFWAAAAVIVLALVGRIGAIRREMAPRQAAPAPAPTQTAAPAAAPVPQASATPAPVRTAAPTVAPAPAENGIRPELREFLDAYEAFMDEYAEFMQRYMKAGAADMVSMMGDYSDMLARCDEFTEALDAWDESEMTSAELAYYLEVTNRVSQKLLKAVG